MDLRNYMEILLTRGEQGLEETRGLQNLAADQAADQDQGRGARGESLATAEQRLQKDSLQDLHLLRKTTRESHDVNGSSLRRDFKIWSMKKISFDAIRIRIVEV